MSMAHETNDRDEKPMILNLPTLLTALGALPFLIFSIDLYLGWLPVRQDQLLELFTSYSLMIVVFMCGVLWGYGISKKPFDRLLYTFSTVGALLAWGTWVLSTYAVNLGVFFGIYLALLIIDNRLYLKNAIPLWFYRLRCAITFIVLICHGLVLNTLM